MSEVKANRSGVLVIPAQPDGYGLWYLPGTGLRGPGGVRLTLAEGTEWPERDLEVQAGSLIFLGVYEEGAETWGGFYRIESVTGREVQLSLSSQEEFDLAADRSYVNETIGNRLFVLGLPAGLSPSQRQRVYEQAAAIMVAHPENDQDELLEHIAAALRESNGRPVSIAVYLRTSFEAPIADPDAPCSVTYTIDPGPAFP